jgi:hypothetical protein
VGDEVGISCSTLVERFTRYLAEPSMIYLSRWRLQLAVKSLEGRRAASRTSPPTSATNRSRPDEIADFSTHIELKSAI